MREGMLRTPATDSMPGVCRRSARSSRYRSVARDASLKSLTGTDVVSTSNRRASKPMSTLVNATRLRIRIPAPTTSTTASAISVTTSTLRAMPVRAPVEEPLPPCRRPSVRRTFET